VSRRFGLNEPIFKVYTSIEDMLLETKWLLKVQLNGFLGMEFNNENAFLFLANVYNDFPVLHEWLTYEFVNTGDITQALLNTKFSLEEVLNHVRKDLYYSNQSSSAGSDSLIVVSKFLRSLKLKSKSTK
jgi:hypothetical protein